MDNFLEKQNCHKKNKKTYSSSGNSFIPQIFIKCAQHSVRHWRYSSEQQQKMSLFSQCLLSGGMRQTINKLCRVLMNSIKIKKEKMGCFM